MTSHIAAMTMDGAPVSATEMARVQAEEQLHAAYARRAARVVAAAAHDAHDCRDLLQMLGLGDDIVAAARAERPAAPARRRRARTAA